MAEIHPLTPDREDLGTFVRSRRKANGLTQIELAELAGVGPRFVSELERGKSTIRLNAVDAVLGVFGMRVGAVPIAREARHRPDKP
jgi:y4mF family transcriptional regulator